MEQGNIYVDPNVGHLIDKYGTNKGHFSQLVVANTYLPFVFLFSYGLRENVHGSPTKQTEKSMWVQETSSHNKLHNENINTQENETVTAPVWDQTGLRTNTMLVRRERTGQVFYLGVRISLYCSFSTLVVAATDMGITMLLMSKELSPRLLLMGCCWGTKEHVKDSI